MVLDTATNLPPESLAVPTETPVFTANSAASNPAPHCREAASGKGSPSPRPLTPDSCPLTPSPQPLPPLSASDHARLSTYTQLRFNPCTLAEREKLPLLQVLTWLNSPHIRPHLREIRKAFALSLKLRAVESRHTVIDALEDVINTTEDLVEKRRAATTLLRALNPPRRPARYLHSTGTPTSPNSSSTSSVSSWPLPRSAPAAAATYSSPSAAAAAQFDDCAQAPQDARPAGRRGDTSSRPSSLASPAPAPEGRSTMAKGEAERNPWNADLSLPRPEEADETIESIARKALNACITRFGATDPLISLLNPDRTVNLDRVNEIADQTDREDDEELDIESEDQPDDFQDPRPPVGTSSRRSFVHAAAHNTS